MGVKSVTIDGQNGVCVFAKLYFQRPSAADGRHQSSVANIPRTLCLWPEHRTTPGAGCSQPGLSSQSRSTISVVYYFFKLLCRVHGLRHRERVLDEQGQHWRHIMMRHRSLAGRRIAKPDTYIVLTGLDPLFFSRACICRGHIQGCNITRGDPE